MRETLEERKIHTENERDREKNTKIGELDQKEKEEGERK